MGTQDQKPFLGFAPPSSNVTYTPNQFFDVVLRHGSRGVVRLVAYVLRKSLGWNDENGNPVQERIRVSYGDLEAGAGISREMIRKGLDEAVEANFLVCVQEGRAKSRGQGAVSAVYELCWDESGDYITDPKKFKGFYAPEGNRTNVPNEFFDIVIQREKLSVAKVVGAIIRDTIGWTFRAGHRRQQVRISYTTIQQRTGIKDRGVLADAIQEALGANYILLTDAGFFDPMGGERSKAAMYGIKWVNSAVCVIGQKNPPARVEAADDRSEKPTGIGQKNPPADRSENPTVLEIKPRNETFKEMQQQGLTAQPVPAADESEIITKLIEIGFDKPTALALASKYPETEILQQINWLEKRRPSRNKLGMLRRAIEEGWQEPLALAKADQPSSKPVATHAQAFAAHFYAGHAGNKGAPVADPSEKDIETAKRLLDRLLTVWPDEAKAPEWGRSFGEYVREKTRDNSKFVVSLVLAARSYGDAFFQGHQTRKECAFREALTTARWSHKDQFAEAHIAYLRTLEERYKAEYPDDFAAFEEDRAGKRLEIVNQRFAYGKEERLEHFDSEAEYLKAFQQFFSDPEESPIPVLEFWDWDAELNPSHFDESSIRL